MRLRSGAQERTERPIISRETEKEDRTSDHIRRDIERTRSEMSSTIDALEGKVSPRHLVNQFFESLRVSDQTRRRVLHTIRRNAVPSTLVAAGLAWLAIKSIGHDKSAPIESRQLELEEYERGQSLRQKAHEKASGARGKAHEKAEEAKEWAREKTESAKAGAHRLSEKAHEAAESVRHGAERTSHALSHATEVAREKAHHAKESFWDTFQSHPLAIGAAAGAAGVLAGLLVPSSRQEDHLMGRQRDRLAARAAEAGEEALERGEHVAQAAAGAAEQEARQQGLATPVEGAAEPAPPEQPGEPY